MEGDIGREGKGERGRRGGEVREGGKAGRRGDPRVYTKHCLNSASYLSH